MNFEDMQNRVYAVLRDDQREFIHDEEVEVWLNEAQEELAHRLKILQTETTGVVGASQKISVPSNFIDAVSLHIGSDNQRVQWVDADYFDRFLDDASTPINAIGRIFGSSIEVRPKPAVGAAYTLRYIKSPAAIDSITNTVSELPVELHIKMVNYARYQAKLKESELGDADRYRQEFELGLPPHSLGQARLNPGPVSLRYAAGPFDVTGSHRG